MIQERAPAAAQTMSESEDHRFVPSIPAVTPLLDPTHDDEGTASKCELTHVRIDVLHVAACDAPAVIVLDTGVQVFVCVGAAHAIAMP